MTRKSEEFISGPNGLTWTWDESLWIVQLTVSSKALSYRHEGMEGHVTRLCTPGLLLHYIGDKCCWRQCSERSSIQPLCLSGVIMHLKQRHGDGQSKPDLLSQKSQHSAIICFWLHRGCWRQSAAPVCVRVQRNSNLVLFLTFPFLTGSISASEVWNPFVVINTCFLPQFSLRLGFNHAFLFLFFKFVIHCNYFFICSILCFNVFPLHISSASVVTIKEFDCIDQQSLPGCWAAEKIIT